MKIDNELPIIMNPANCSRHDVIELKGYYALWKTYRVGPWFSKPNLKMCKAILNRASRMNLHHVYTIDITILKLDSLFIVDLNIVDGKKIRIHPLNKKSTPENTELLDYDAIITRDAIKVGKLKKTWFRTKIIRT